MSEEAEVFKKLEPSEVHAFIINEHKVFHDRMLELLSKIHPRQRWLICARLINFIFGDFYKMSVNCGEQEAAKKFLEGDE